jgi:hypothetical protein
LPKEAARWPSIAPGRFWITPRQNLIATVFALPRLSPDEAIRLLAGDVAGSPYLRGGLAVDLVREIHDGANRALLVGAASRGERVSQLRIDSATGRATSVIEQFPVFGEGGHASAGPVGIVETKLLDFIDAGGVRFPSRLERIIDGRWSQEVKIENVGARPDFPVEKFDLARLGGLPAGSSIVDSTRAGGASGPSAVPIRHRTI